MAPYTTVEHLREYAGFAADDFYTEERLQKAVEDATKDIDRALGNYPRDRTTGQKIITTTLEPYQLARLQDATAAQGEYRLVKGEEFFINYRPALVTGPDGSVEGTEPYLAPKARAELGDGNLFRLTSGPGTVRRSLPTP